MKEIKGPPSPSGYRLGLKKWVSESLLHGVTRLFDRLSPRLRETWRLRLFGLFKIPILFFITPTVTEVTDQRIVVRVPLNWRTRNHLRSMYFGVLAAGADCACGLLAVRIMDQRLEHEALKKKVSKGKISLIFKDFKAEFLKRPEGDTYFICEQGEAIAQLVDRVIQTRDRQNLPVEVIAQVQNPGGGETVARFILTLSLKYQEVM